MKTKCWAKFSTVFAFSLLWTSCSSDWGKVDPPAGVDVAPTLEKVCEYTFDEEDLDASVFTVVPYPDGSMPALIDDDMVQSTVLDLTGGYAKIKNPLASYDVQKAVSLTFWMKQVLDPRLDDEGNPIEDKYEPQDVVTPLLHWENLNSTCTFDFSTNGWINYDGADGKISIDDPSEYKTGHITPNEWHYIAVVVSNDGYGLYVDGLKKTEAYPEKSLSSAVQLLAQAENLYINYGASTHSKYLIDDLKIYRNQITSKEIARPAKGKIGLDDVGEEQGFDPRKWLGVGLEDCSTPWWTPSTFSKVYKYDLKQNMPFTFTFYNYNNGTMNNWCNWLLVCTNGLAFGDDGYSEFFVLRSDAYGWGSAYNGDNIGHGFNWDTYCKDMDGAYVRLFLEYDGETVYMTAKIISDNGTPEGAPLQDYTFSAPVQGEIGFFLLCEGSYLDLRSLGYTPFRNQAN